MTAECRGRGREGRLGIYPEPDAPAAARAQSQERGDSEDEYLPELSSLARIVKLLFTFEREGDRVMKNCYRMWLGVAALCAFSHGALPAMAEQEIGEPTSRYVEQASDMTCDDIDAFEQSKICTGEEMRWQLCERGSDAEHLESVAVYECFLRSR